MKWGRTDRPADQPQDGPVRDAARPGSYVGNVLGCCAREAASQLAMADRRVVKLRPVPQEPCRRREEPASAEGTPRPGCPRGRSERRSKPLRMCPFGAIVGRAQCSIPPVSTPGRLFGERSAQSYAAGPGFGGQGIPPGFSAGNSWKSQKLTPLLPNARAKRRVSGHRRPKCSE